MRPSFPPFPESIVLMFRCEALRAWNEGLKRYSFDDLILKRIRYGVHSDLMSLSIQPLRLIVVVPLMRDKERAFDSASVRISMLQQIPFWRKDEKMMWKYPTFPLKSSLYSFIARSVTGPSKESTTSCGTFAVLSPPGGTVPVLQKCCFETEKWEEFAESKLTANKSKTAVRRIHPQGSVVAFRFAQIVVAL